MKKRILALLLSVSILCTTNNVIYAGEMIEKSDNVETENIKIVEQDDSADSIQRETENLIENYNLFQEDENTLISEEIDELEDMNSNSDFLVEDGTLVQYTGEESSVVIPEDIVEIGDSAFSKNKVVVSVTLPNSVVKIGERAFEECGNLKSIEFSNELEDIGNYAFYNCWNLASMPELPASLKRIGNGAFLGCEKMAGELKLPECLESIEADAFSNCRSLTGRIELPPGIRRVENGTFNGCRGFTGQLVLPDTLEYVGNIAFYGCSGLKGMLEIGNGVKEIGDQAFSWCEKLESMTFLGKVPPSISNPNEFFRNIPALKDVWVPRGSYNEYSIRYGTALPSTIRLRTQGSSDFLIENGTLSVYLGEAEEVQVPEGVTEIGAGAFAWNKGIKKVFLPESVEKIGEMAFYQCDSLREVSLPESVKEIGSYAFYHCKSLTEIALPVGLESVEEYTFGGCENLAVLPELPEGLKRIGHAAFFRCKKMVGELEFPSGLESIGASAFASCQSLTGTLELPSGIKRVEGGTFSSCSGLTGQLVLPDTLEYIGDGAFNSCIGLQGVLEIGKYVKKIGNDAFAFCSNITGVVLGENITMLGGEDYSSVFSWCGKLENMTFLGKVPPEILYKSEFFLGLSNLKTIYTLPESLEEYKTAYGSYVDSKVIFSADTMQLPIPGFQADKVYSNTVNLTWRPSLNDKVVKYQLYRDDSTVPIWEGIDSTYSDTGLHPGTLYTYYLYGVTEDGQKTIRSSVIVEPKIPQIIKIYTDNKYNKVSLTNSDIYIDVMDTQNLGGLNGVVTEGKIYYTDADSKKNIIADHLTQFTTNGKNVVSYQVTWNIKSLPEGTYPVTFELKDVDGNIVTLTEEIEVNSSQPDKISNCTAIGNTNQIEISWGIAYELDTDKYYIYRRKENEDDFTKIATIYGRENTNYTDLKAEENVKYYYYVTGVNEFGQESEPSNTAVATPQTDMEAPVVVKITPVSGSFLNGKQEIYAQAIDNIDVVKTQLFLSEDGENWQLIKENNDDYCKYILDTAAYGEKKIYIKAVAFDGIGNESSGLKAVYIVDNSGPDKVKGLSYESTSTTVTLKWEDVEAPDFSFFRVEQKQEDGSFKKYTDVYQTLGVNITDLNPNTAYIFQVVAYDQMGNRGGGFRRNSGNDKVG